MRPGELALRKTSFKTPYAPINVKPAGGWGGGEGEAGHGVGI